jgi:rod shape-determining protein MreB and related proteins
MPIHVADEPLHSVVIGSGKCIEEFESLKRVLISSQTQNY